MSGFTPRGMLTRDALEQAGRTGDIDTVITVFPDLYGRLVGKRISNSFFLEHVSSRGMHACDYLLACDMEMDPVPGYRFTSWDTGYGDVLCVPDLSTLRRASWMHSTALVLCDVLREETPEAPAVPVEVAPRRILQRQLETAADMGYTVLAGVELEFYLFHESYESARAKHYHDLQPSASIIEDYQILQGSKEEALVGTMRRGLELSGVPVESTKGEWGAGQQEINLHYCNALTQADRAVLCKHAVKEIAQSQGRSLTFMSKWDERVAGSGMHLHLSLWDGPGERSRFTGEEPLGPVKASETCRWFLGGLLRHAAELSGFFAPNVTAYKRFQSGSFAPTALAWSYDNRTAGFRMVGSGTSLRIECRIPGADANPYIALAAAIAAGLEGVRAKVEPPPVFEGDVYQAEQLPRLPATLPAAIEALQGSRFARESLGEDVVEHYLHFLRTEQRKFEEVVTCWERARYFERV